MRVYMILSGCYKVIKKDEKLTLLIIHGDANMRLSYMFIWIYFDFIVLQLENLIKE
jgi:hypothetical protein